jgi:hypothetical protein
MIAQTFSRVLLNQKRMRKPLAFVAAETSGKARWTRKFFQPNVAERTLPEHFLICCAAKRQAGTQPGTAVSLSGAVRAAAHSDR